jgi:hypothetical protein
LPAETGRSRSIPRAAVAEAANPTTVGAEPTTSSLS